MDNLDEEIRKNQLERKVENGELASFGEKYAGQFDKDIYTAEDKDKYVDEVIDEDENEDAEKEDYSGLHPATIQRRRKEEADARENEMDEMRLQGGSMKVNTRIADRENDYQRQHRKRTMSPERSDPYKEGAPSRGYKEVMKEKLLKEEEADVYKQIVEKEKEEQERQSQKRDEPDAKPVSKWDAPTPTRSSTGTASTASETPTQRSWAETPARGDWDVGARTVDGTPGGKRSRWDETPASRAFGSGTATPLLSGGQTPLAGGVSLVQQEMMWRNRPLSDEELDALLPGGYRIVTPPESYKPKIQRVHNLMGTPTPLSTPGFSLGDTPTREVYGMQTPVVQEVPLYAHDQQQFADLLKEVDETKLTKEEARDRKIMILLLKVKNGTPLQRKGALRQLTEGAVSFGAGPLFNRIIPLLTSTELEDQERHLLIKVLNRVLFKLDSLVRPYVHKILVVVEPMLIDEDYFARVEGREVISNLAKAAGLAYMISTMREDLDSQDEDARNTTARAFSVVASALGIPAMLPFLRAVCKSKKNWMARHTGIKIIYQIAQLMGCAVLPHLRHLVECIKDGLNDKERKVQTITALALAALAEASFPYGIESFDCVLGTLWESVKTLRGKSLAAYLKAVGFIIPLMDETRASLYINDVMHILIRECSSPDEEMRKVVIKVVKQCVQTDGISVEYIRDTIMPEFFRNMWTRRTAGNRYTAKILVETTNEIAQRVGAQEVIQRLVPCMKDENEWFRYMVLNSIRDVIGLLGTSDLDTRLEEQLIDGLLFAFQEQAGEDASAVVNCFGTVLKMLGVRAKPYMSEITDKIKWRLGGRNANVRMQAADLIARIAPSLKQCGEENALKNMGKVLYEYLGEEYPDVLGSILGALKSIVNVMGMEEMEPPIRDLLPRLTPILRNRHEKVQENCIDLVGRIADRGSEFVPAKEWSRICFDLLDMLNAKKKSIRRTTVNTFGYIAKALGPQDVMYTLLNNLKVQERQNRLCTSIAIAIVAEACEPFTVLPSLMNEYRLPEMNVQNGVLKAMSFMFEYIGETASNYIYACIPVLEDALMDRDLIHRQQASAAISHLAVGVYGEGCEDGIQHLLNYVFPNIFEVSPHLNKAVLAAIESCRLALGPPVVLMYVLQGLFHPARRVREVYWKIYNNLYIYGADALTMAYPRLEDDGVNTYRREYIEMFIWV
ncbi:hypothetical protein WA556_003782 [Blastocystis sp. ATCC 50177/Nand II]